MARCPHCQHDPDEWKYRLSAGLTPTEQRTVKLVVEGCSNQEIANRLRASSTHAIGMRLNRIYTKLELRNRAELIVYCLGAP